ncbi:serine/threonine protein kinase [Clostridium beijerinckii]|uniref:serine/threonine protein kinase n=1 Tax=Clostridium beijerinckii TaxID=1520 RepID=UPI00311A9F3D
MNSIEKIKNIVADELLPQLNLQSINPNDPIVVRDLPSPWILLGSGNYASVLYHPDFPEFAVKIYARGKLGIEDEINVYKKLGIHRAYSQCYYGHNNFLILKRLEGETLYNCLKKGIFIPVSVIKDIDEALDYAKHQGLNPHDVHVKNVMMLYGKGVIVDVSDFYKNEPCYLWEDFKKIYFKVYLPLFRKIHFPISDFLLNSIRKSYRFYKKYIS